MAFRSLTDVYILMRNNAITNKSVFNDNQYSDDRTALVLDLETGNARTSSKIPPSWTIEVDDIQYEITRIKNKLKELSTLHDKHLNRPTLDDNIDGEKAIDALTQEITQTLSSCQMNIRKLSIKANSTKSASDKRLMKNVVTNLATSLQDLTMNFRKNQNLYLKKIQSRKERSNMLFDTSQYSSSTALMHEENEFDDFQQQQQKQSNFNFQQEQLQVQRVNERLLNEREQEINHIVKSINDLNELFKDIATMVVDQGTVLDRIDCNIERVSYSVEKGLGELEKAAKYQKASRKMYIIAVLMVIFLILFFLLILTKF